MILYDDKLSIKEKIEIITKEIYHAGCVNYTDSVLDKIKYDIEYVKNLSLMLDLKILWLTVYKVLKREDVGVETSGVVHFNNYRSDEWTKEGRLDKIDAAKKEMQEIMNKYNIKW